MTTITAEQHTALLAAIYAIAQKEIDARDRGDLQSADHMFTQYGVVRDLLDYATIEAEDPPPLWRDSDREDWMMDDEIHLELADAPYVTACHWRGGSVLGTYVAIEAPDEMVHVESEHLPALIAMLQEVQRRIEAGDAL